MTDFLTIDYLRSGTERQQAAYIELTELEIFKKLQAYKPLLAGTIPIDIAIDDSDLDIVCACQDHKEFAGELVKLFGKQKFFTIITKQIDGVTATIAKFEGQSFPIEIFGQTIDSVSQNAFKHMLIEHRILEKNGIDFRNRIIALKKTGMKTEPAFAYLLGLSGDPYKKLLEFT